MLTSRVSFVTGWLFMSRARPCAAPDLSHPAIVVGGPDLGLSSCVAEDFAEPDGVGRGSFRCFKRTVGFAFAVHPPLMAHLDHQEPARLHGLAFGAGSTDDARSLSLERALRISDWVRTWRFMKSFRSSPLSSSSSIAWLHISSCRLESSTRVSTAPNASSARSAERLSPSTSMFSEAAGPEPRQGFSVTLGRDR